MHSLCIIVLNFRLLSALLFGTE